MILKLKHIPTFIICLFWATQTFSQNSKLTILPQIKLPNDSVVSSKLLRSLHQFLNDKNDNLKYSSVIDSNHYKRYADFFDLFKNVEKSKRYNDDNFFKCYLKNIVLQPDNSYQIDLSYFGLTKSNEIVHRLDISMLAKETQNNFFFYCPFERNTKYWKSSKVGNITFYYKGDLNKSVALDFDKYNTSIAKKLKLDPIQFDFYNCKDIQEVYGVMGIDYDISRNGEVRSGSFDIKNQLFIAGTNTDQYKHDLTHGYFSLKFADSIRNWTAEEGYNIYTTDYWGESSENIFNYLRSFIKQNPNTSLYEAFQKNIDLKHPIPIKYPLSALLIRRVEREFGFEKVLELVSSGESDDNYFKILYKLIGLTKDNFDEIIKNELQK
ncbi:MAG TPA: hypothetical protein PK006_08760 [Saprospiraceae bacterium]|nr:hypothetical protein [Saprospiraceae bacterium]